MWPLVSTNHITETDGFIWSVSQLFSNCNVTLIYNSNLPSLVVKSFVILSILCGYLLIYNQVFSDFKWTYNVRWKVLEGENFVQMSFSYILSNKHDLDNPITVWTVSVFGVILDTKYLSVFSPNAGKYGPE